MLCFNSFSHDGHVHCAPHFSYRRQHFLGLWLKAQRRNDVPINLDCTRTNLHHRIDRSMARAEVVDINFNTNVFQRFRTTEQFRPMIQLNRLQDLKCDASSPGRQVGAYSFMKVRIGKGPSGAFPRRRLAQSEANVATFDNRQFTSKSSLIEFT